MTKSEKFKQQLARVFDNDLRTKQWENYVDYAIIGLIVISTLSVFISTFEVSPICEQILHIIDIITVIAFTIEVSLRIWAADEIDSKYKGFWGRVRYCFTFYGLIDILSTYTFYASIFIPLPYTVLKSLRVVRLLRVFRYMRSFRLLQQALMSKSKEMFISLQFLVVVTLMLSFVLFFYEHAAQPEVYNNGFKSVLWAFAQYIGDPGGFADTPPITFAGRLIACIIGLLGIALFAVPAGLVGAGFSEAMSAELHKEETAKNIEKLNQAFERKLDRPTGFQVVPQHLSICDIQARMGMKVDDIFDAVEASDNFRLINLAVTQTIDEHPQDKLVLEHFYINRPYGCCIDRGSKVTIVSTSGYSEPMSSWLAYHIAKLGGFNYVAKDIETNPDDPTTYYNITNVDDCPNLKLFIEDINRLSSKPDSWVIPILGATGLRNRPTQFHFCYNSKKHDASYDDPKARIVNYEAFDKMYNKMESEISEKFDLHADKNEWYAVSSANIAHFIKAENVFTLRIECFVYIFNNTFLNVIKTIADVFNYAFEPDVQKTLPPEMVTRRKGHDFGMRDYID